MASEQMVRITAKGEFGQLRSGLKNLQNDLRNVTGEIDRGARKGGIFDENQLRALDLFKRRFKDTMGELDREFRRQNEVVDELHRRMSKATFSEREEIRKNIKEREKELDVIRRQLMNMEKIYNQRTKEANSFGRPTASSPTSMGGGGGGSALSGMLGGAASRIMGAGRFMLGLAGIGGIAGLTHEAYQAAYTREVGSLDLAQRLRGGGDRFGSATDMYDQSGRAGMRGGLGFTKQESWQFLEQYSRLGGNITSQEQHELLKFARGYGLEASEAASLVGTHRGVGGSAPSDFADSIASSVAQSGMTSRIVEVMETNNTLLEQMNTTLKDGSAKQILAYQTTLDRIGLEQGMHQLTGAQGANLIGGLGGIFSPENDNWKWMGIRALQSYDPQKYGDMSLFELEMAFEDGLMNEDNIPALRKEIAEKSGGNKELALRMLQRWLRDGGFGASKRETMDFWDATDGLTVFNKEHMDMIKATSVDSGAAFDKNVADEVGQGFRDLEARFQQAIEGLGSELVKGVAWLKEQSVTALEWLDGELEDTNSTLGKIYDFMTKNLEGLALATGVAIVASNIIKVVAAIAMLARGGGVGGAVPTGGDSKDGKKGSKGATIAKTAGGAAIAAMILGLIEGELNEEEHRELAEQLGFDPNDQTAIDRGVVGAYDSIDGLVEMVTGKDYLTREQGYKVMAKIDPAHEDSWTQQWAKNYMEKEQERFNSLPPEKQSAEEENRKKAEEYRKRYEEDPWGTDWTSALPDAIGNGLQWGANKIVEGVGKGWDKLWGNKQEELKDAGNSELGRFADEGSLALKDFNKDSSLKIREIADIHTVQMDKVAKEHSGFKTMMYFLFEPIAEAFRNPFSGTFGSLPTGGGRSPEGSFFKGWQNRVTSRFGASEGFRGGHSHSGLDIDGEQGDFIDALASGVISKITYDDGSPLDNDGKPWANSNPGGTEVVIRMPDGRSYSYSHLSAVNPNLKVGDRVDAGQWVGNMGGDEGMPGSGSSTTGSHLHLGYYDQNGVRRNPEELLAGLNAGDSTLGKAGSSEVTVNVNITGEGASSLNQMTAKQLEAFIIKVMQETERRRLSTSPTRAGYGL